MNKVVKKVLNFITNYLVNFATAMWEECLKEYLHEQIKSEIIRGINLIKATRDTSEYQVKRDKLVNQVLDRVKLPKLLIPFKWLIKKVILKTVTEEVTKALNKLEDSVNK